MVGGDGLKVFFGNGDGTFGSPQSVYSDYGFVHIADIDLDGRADIVVSTLGNGLVGLRGQGDGTFRPAVEFPTGSDNTGRFVLRDLNGDGTPEVVVGNLLTALTVLLNASQQHR